MSKKAEKLILIDGNAIIHRSYHALPPLTNKKGELLNAVYGFTSTVLSVLDKFKPDYIIATFDLSGPTFRHEDYKEYKATRVKADQALYDQIPRVKEVVNAFNIPIFECQGCEADDVIGTLASQAEAVKDGPEIMIVTGDLDTLQLVTKKTKVYTMRRGLTDSVIYNEEAVRERYSLAPWQMIDYKGLRGDASDNIPGVKGIGEKTAIELLKKYETVEGVYKNIHELKGAVREKLERDKMMAIKSKRLATIKCDVPVELDLALARAHDFDRAKLVELMKELNFFSLIKRIPASGRPEEISAKNIISAGVRDFKYDLVAENNAREIFSHLKEQKELAMRLYTAGERIMEREILGISFSWRTGRAVYAEWNENNIPFIKDILEDEKISKIGCDVKTDMEVLLKGGIGIKGSLFDIMLAQYVLNPGAKIEFSKMVLEELGEEIEEPKKKGQLGLAIESKEETGDKKCRDVDYIFKLKEIYETKIREISSQQGEEKNIAYVFSEIETPLIKILAEMEIHGVKLNKTIFEGISQKINARIKNLEKSIYESAGKEFNINSSRQLAEILFEHLKLPTLDIKKGKTGYSTAAGELGKLRGEHKIIEKIEEYREIFKLKTTYLDTLPALCDSGGRIHTSFNQAVTATGRLSSSDPNLQNIPIRTDLGQMLRTAFEAEVGWRLVAADYSQIDLRVVAHVSGDKKMIELFHAGEDIHKATAAAVYKVTPSQVTDRMRRSAKALNFGVIYGMSVFGFSEAAHIDRDDAKKYINEYMEKFSGIAKYMKNTREFVKLNQYVETEVGRRRYIPEINSPNFQVAGAAERMAINMPIQGLAADIVKLAMIAVHEEYKSNPNVKVLLQVHDEIILEVKEEMADEVGKRVKEIMENVYKLKVPLVVDVKIGDNWGEV